MNESSEYIENILLEIVNRPRFWLKKGHSNKFNIETFNSQKLGLAFLQENNQRNFVRGQKIIQLYNNQPLHLIVRDCKYGKIDKDSKEICNTTVEFIYLGIIFSEIKWPKLSINSQKESQSKNKNQSRTTYEIIDLRNTTSCLLSSQFINHSSALSNIIEDSQDSNYQSRILDEETHYRSSIIIDLNQNDINQRNK